MTESPPPPVAVIRVPDLGDFSEVPVIEIHVAPGDVVSAEDPLITLESDKATMDVPAPSGGTVKEITVNIGDTVSAGSSIAVLESTVHNEFDTVEPDIEQAAAAAMNEDFAVKIPDIGDFADVPIIEIMVKEGDGVSAEMPLLTLESDKATMDVPAPVVGIVKSIRAQVGDTVSQGDWVLTLTQGATVPPKAPADPEPAPEQTISEDRGRHAGSTARPSPTATIASQSLAQKNSAHASPSIRRLARKMGVDLGRVKPTGRKGRVLKEDVQGYVKSVLTGQAKLTREGTGIPPVPEIDFAKFGPVDTVKLKRIQKISGDHLHRAWLNVPHVTHHDEADITEMEAFRKQSHSDAEKRGVRLTGLAFIMKALVAALREYPSFNASLTASGEEMVFKRYFHLGIAVDTNDGLVVPVIRDVDRKSLFDLAAELAQVSERARQGNLSPGELQGGCMSISSLGGIGGTAFTPIVNAPEVAVLGVTRSRMSPVWNGDEFLPRLMLPLDMSYDHRVIDGAAAARFMAALCRSLSDIRRLLL